MTVGIKREALPLRRRKWLAFLDCGAAAELPLLPPPTSTATSSASDIPRAFVEQYDRCDTDNEIAGAFRALNPRTSSAIEAKDAQPHDAKGPRRPASARMPQPGTADAAPQSNARGARPPSPAGGARRLVLPPRLGPGRGPPPCCPQCGLTRFPRGPPPPPLLRGRMGGRSYPPRPFMGPRTHSPGRGMPPRPGMWWVGRGPRPPRPGMGRGPRGAMRGGYGRGQGRGGRCCCNAMGPMRGVGGRPLPPPGGMVGPPPGRGGRGRGVGVGPGRSCDQSSAALLSCARPEARPEDEGDLAQPAPPVSRSNSATRNEAGLLMRVSSRKDGISGKAAPADLAVSPSVKPQSVEAERVPVSNNYDPEYIGQGGPMPEGGMSKRRPKSAPPARAGSTRPEDSIKEESRPLPHQVDLPGRFQPAAARAIATPNGVAKDQRDIETTRTMADGPTDGLAYPEGVARPLSAATRASSSCQPTATATSGCAGGSTSSGVLDLEPLTAARSKATPVAETRGSSELTAPPEAAAANLPAPPLSVEDVIAAALEKTCIVLAGVGGAAATATPGGGWLVAAAIPPGRLSSRKKDGTKNNNNVDVAARVEGEEDGPKTVTSCTQWEESDVLVDNAPKVSPRTIPQLWAKKTTPTVIVPNPFFVGVEDKPATKPDAKAATAGGRYRANGSDATEVVDASTAATPATASSSNSGSGNSSSKDGVRGLAAAATSGEGSAGSKTKPSSTSLKGCSKPSATDTAPTEWPTPSTLEPPISNDTDQGGEEGGGCTSIAARGDGRKRVKGTMVDPAGAMSAAASGPEGCLTGTSTLGLQTDVVERDQHAVLGGVESGHLLTIPSSRPSDLDEGVTTRAPSPPEAVAAAEVDEQQAGERTPPAEDERVEPLYLPGSLVDAATAAAATSRVSLHQEEEIVAGHVEAAKDPAANTLRDGGGRDGLDSLTPPTACSKEFPTTTAQTPPLSRAASSMGRSSPGEGGGAEGGSLDAFPVTTKKPSRQTKQLPSSNTTNHNAKAAPASKPTHAAAPLATPGIRTTPLSGQPWVPAGDGSVPHGVERSPEDGGTSTVPSGPGGRPVVSDSSGIFGFREVHEESDGHAGKYDEAGDGSVVVEMKETQTEDDIDVAVRKADAPQRFFRARPWATQLEHEFVPDDSAGESFGTIIIAESGGRRLPDTTAVLENG